MCSDPAVSDGDGERKPCVYVPVCMKQGAGNLRVFPGLTASTSLPQKPHQLCTELCVVSTWAQHPDIGDLPLNGLHRMAAGVCSST